MHNNKLTTLWFLVSEGFGGGWMYLPCVVAVLGAAKAAVGIALATLVSLLCLSCMLVVRRRRAVVLQSWRCGFITTATATAASASSKKGTINQINNLVNKGGSNKDDEGEDETTLCLADLRPSATQHWPDGATRMFEGSDIFHCDLTVDELWKFCFLTSSSSSKKKSASASPWYDFACEFYETILSDAGIFCSLMYDAFQGFSALALVAMILLGTPDYSSRSSLFDELSTFRRYFYSNSHAFVGAVAAFLIFAAARIFDARRVRMWYVAIIVALMVFAGVRDRFLLNNNNNRHFPSNEGVFDLFFAAPTTLAARKKDLRENQANALFVMAKRPLANPTACLLNEKYNSSQQQQQQQDAENGEPPAVIITDYVPFARQFLVYMLCAFFSFFSEAAGVRRQPIPEAGAPVDPLRLMEDESTRERERSISQAVANVNNSGNKIQQQQQQQQQTQQTQAAALLRDSVAHTAAEYAPLLALRAAVGIVFAVAATWVSPMMSWEVSFSSWLGVVMVKSRNDAVTSSYSAMDYVLVLATVTFHAFAFIALTVPRFLARVRSPLSLFSKYPVLRTLLVVAIALLLGARQQTHMSAAMTRGENERSLPTTEADDSELLLLQSNHQHAQQHSHHSYLPNVVDIVGVNPWALLSKTNFLFSGLRLVTVPLLMLSKSEQAMLRLGIPRGMISVHATRFLDGGVAKVVAGAFALFWTYIVWEYC